MIRPFSEEDAWCYWVISVGALLSFLGFIVACICSCRRNETKNEFLGLAGMVTLNSAENESFAGIPNDVSARASVQDAADAGKRTTGANRSLPDIPKDRRHDDTTESVSQDIYETTETIADNSELYATVQGAGLAAEVSEQEMQQQVDQRNSSIRENSARRYSRFAVVGSDNGTNEVEHPYAQLQDVQKIEANQGLNRGNVRSAIETKKPSTPTSQSTSQGGETNPVAPPRTRRSSSHNSLLSDDIGSRGGEIQAANAISGGVQANQELPYMTPPLSMLLPSSQSQLQSATQSANLSQSQSQSQSQPQSQLQSQSELLSQSQSQSQSEPQPQSQSQPSRSCQPQSTSPQQHFSGDSQDSKGYTSISVREPLANIIAQTKTVCRQSQSPGRALADPHYATVSDDSDEMYAAIDEQDKVYTSGSETYAQIQPTTEAQRPTQTTEPTSFPPPALSRSDEAQPAAPQPPSVDSLRHVAHAHSRQASSSSANSSIANPGSPKPEKRQANSPLPPPPEGTMDMYASIDKRTSKTETERSKSALSNGKSLEDMYAKVMKKKKEAEEQNDAHSSLYGGSMHHEVAAVSATAAAAAAVAATTAAGTVVRKTSLVELNRTSWSSHDSVETQRKELDSAGCSFASVNPDATKLLQVGGVVGEIAIAIDPYSSSKDPRCSHAIASDPSKKRATRDSNYEPLRARSNSTVDTIVASASASGGGVAATSATAASVAATATAGYSSSVRNATDLTASYNALTLKHRQASNASSEDPGYEKVRLRRRIDADHDTDSEPNYESMPHDSGEPNYASVCRPGDSDTDPNYESVNHGDPNYESVKYMSVARSVADDPPYEQVHGFKSDPNPDGYEQVKKHHGFYSADYERIQPNRSTEPIGNGDTDDEQYVQV